MELEGIESALKALDVSFEELEADAIDAFEEYDKDKTGTISTKELRSFLSDLMLETVDVATANEVFKGVDTDSDGVLSMEEFILLMAKTYIDEAKGRQVTDEKKSEDIETTNANAVEFKKYDEDRDGELNATELKKFLDAYEGRACREDYVKDILKKYDSTGTGGLEMEEYLVFLASGKANSEDSRDRDMVKLFKKYDKDGSGKIDKKELRDLAKELVASGRVTEEKLNEMMADADVDEDGKVDYQEFVMLINDDEL